MIPPLKWMHVWFGRCYIFFMILATFCSLLIYNSGLPEPVLWSFLFTGIGITFGWVAIKFHQAKLHHAALALVESRLGEEQRVDASFKLQEAVAAAKRDVSWAKTGMQRFFSYKAFHGLMMFWSCEGLFGRLFASNQSGDFTCYTYPVFKPVNSNQYATDGMILEGEPLRFLPLEDPNAASRPWARMGGDWVWMGVCFATPVAAALLFGIAFSLVSARRENKMVEHKSIELS